MNPEINLLPVFEKRKPESYLGLILFIIVLGALIVFLAIYLMGIKQDAADLAAEEQNLTAQRAALQSELATGEPAPEITYADAVLFVETNSYPVSPLYEEIQQSLNPTTYVRSYIFEPSKITLSLDFETKAELATLIQQLLKSNYFEDVYVDAIGELESEEATEGEDSTAIQNSDEKLLKYTSTLILIPLPEFLTEGVTQP